MKMNNKIKPEKRENREPRFVLEIDDTDIDATIYAQKFYESIIE